MGITKSHFFTKKQNEIAKLAKAIGHPARVAILEHLMKVKSCICGELVFETELAQATVSQHLKELKEAGIIKGTIEGNAVCYCIESKALSILSTFLTKMNKIETNENCCN